jgi:hypothetical protein
MSDTGQVSQDRWGSAIYLTRTRSRRQGNILIFGAIWEGKTLEHSAIMSCSVQGLNKEHPAAKQAPSLALSRTVRATARRKVDLAGSELGLPLVQQQTRLHISMQR